MKRATLFFIGICFVVCGAMNAANAQVVVTLQPASNQTISACSIVTITL